MNWKPITKHWPKPLEDVFVSTLIQGETKPMVFHAWRSSNEPDAFLLTGSAINVPGHVYAYADEPDAAPLSMCASIG